MEYKTITVAPVTKNIGAQISGIDLSQPLSELQAEEISHAINKHLVLFFRGQDLTDEQHLEFASNFGTPNVYPVTKASGSDLTIEFIEDNETSLPKADLWHTDVAFLESPPDFAVLSMLHSPEVGGDTMWLNLYQLFDNLSEPLQRFVTGLEQFVHPGSLMQQIVTRTYGEDVWQKVADEFAGVHHPLVRKHPETGKPALFLCGAFAKHIAGLTPAESAALLDLLREGLNDPSTQVRWRWQKHDLVMWDERCTNHRALSDHAGEYRRVRRCTVGAGRPEAM